MSHKHEYDWLYGLRDYEGFLIGHDPRIFNDFLPRITRDKIEEHCQKAVEQGCTSVHPSFAHYRWDFLDHIDTYVDFLANSTEIAHKYNLKVWEHHSVVLTNYLKADTRYKKWQLYKYLETSFKTGQPYSLEMHGTKVFCCSNPYFREAYFDLAKRLVVDNPVDIYMPDDMGYAFSYEGCSCQYCRKLFKEQTGHLVPKGQKYFDRKFHLNMDNPAWRAWLRFRSTRVGLFLEELNKFLVAEGRADLPVTTCNSESLHAYVRVGGNDHEEYDRIGKLGLGFNEIWANVSLLYNWERNFIDRQTNKAIGDYCNIPYYTGTYPRYNEEAVFEEVCTMVVGMGSHTKSYVNNGYKTLNTFKEKYKELIYNSKADSNIGVVFSRNTRDFYREDVFTRTYQELHCDEFIGWCENLLINSIPYQILIDSFVETEDISRFKVIILPNCACMSKKMASKLNDFVKAGGTLIATSETSLFDDTGKKLDNFQLSKLFGFDYATTYSGVNLSIFQNYCTHNDNIHIGHSNFVIDDYDSKIRDLIFNGVSTRRIAHNAQSVLVNPNSKKLQTLAHTPVIYDEYYGYPAVVLNEIGKGRVLYFNGLPGLMSRSVGNMMSPCYGEDTLEVVDDRIAEYGFIIPNSIRWAVEGQEYVKADKYVKGLAIQVKKANKDYRNYIHLFTSPVKKLSEDGKYILREYFPESNVNIDAGTGEEYGNPLKNPEFWKPELDYIEVPGLKLEISKKIKFKKAEMVSIDFVGEKSLRVTGKNNKRYLHIPKGYVKRYSIIVLS